VTDSPICRKRRNIGVVTLDGGVAMASTTATTARCIHCAQELPEAARYCVWCGEDVAAPVNRLAIVALVAGATWVFWVGSLVALVCGPIALRQARRRGQHGAGMAQAAIALGCVGAATFLFVALMLLSLAGSDY
jgi:hypothetical protein